MSVEQRLAEAVKHHQAGELEKARVIYQEIISKNPRHADALHLLGVALHQSRRHEEAAQLIQTAINISPQSSIYYSNFGSCLISLKRFDDAKTVGVKIPFPHDIPDAGKTLPGPVVFGKVEARSLDPVAVFGAGVCFGQADMRDLRVGIGNPRDHVGAIADRQTEQRVADHETRLVARDMGELQTARDVADGIDPAVRDRTQAV